ncbi:unnamed protein product [Ilex paraguariensis]|uniref:PB1-like domain-containing protein n=1 Tax=Ilex paraguariensis TaxID=185542 RepID=A0ABC8R6L1_9AQUA
MKLTLMSDKIIFEMHYGSQFQWEPHVYEGGTTALIDGCDPNIVSPFEITNMYVKAEEDGANLDFYYRILG